MSRIGELLVKAGKLTGPLHLAHALGRSVFCVMGPTDPEQSGPYGALDRVLWKQIPCSSCHEKLEEPKGCLHEVSPEEIASRARALLGERPTFP